MEFLSKLLEILAAIWPLVVISTPQAGGYYLFGNYQATLGPGVYWRTPFFEEIVLLPITTAIVSTPRLDITLKDGSFFSFAVSGRCRVIDADKALNLVDQHQESAVEALAAVCAEKLAEVDISRLNLENRKRLVSDLKRWINEETLEYGVEFDKVRFVTYVPKPRMYRVMQDNTGMAW